MVVGMVPNALHGISLIGFAEQEIKLHEGKLHSGKPANAGSAEALGKP
jgi:hypothetical protein